MVQYWRRLVILQVLAARHARSQTDAVAACRNHLHYHIKTTEKTMVTNTLISPEKLKTVTYLWSDVVARNLPGDWVQIGSFYAECSLVAAKIAREAFFSSQCKKTVNRQIWLLGFSHESLKSLLSIFYVDRFDVTGNSRDGVSIRFIAGGFNETLHHSHIREIAILRLDADLYSSTMIALRHLYKKVQTTGYVIIDDYGWWLQCQRAFDDYFRKYEGWLPALMHDGITGRWMQKPRCVTKCNI